MLGIKSFFLYLNIMRSIIGKQRSNTGNFNKNDIPKIHPAKNHFSLHAKLADTKTSMKTNTSVSIVPPKKTTELLVAKSNEDHLAEDSSK